MDSVLRQAVRALRAPFHVGGRLTPSSGYCDLSTARQLIVMIYRNPKGSHGGCGIWSVERDSPLRSATPFRGRFVNPGLEEPAMFRLPAYDPVGLAMLGFGILAVVALTFAF